MNDEQRNSDYLQENRNTHPTVIDDLRKIESAFDELKKRVRFPFMYAVLYLATLDVAPGTHPFMVVPLPINKPHYEIRVRLDFLPEPLHMTFWMSRKQMEQGYCLDVGYLEHEYRKTIAREI